MNTRALNHRKHSHAWNAPCELRTRSKAHSTDDWSAAGTGPAGWVSDADIVEEKLENKRSKKKPARCSNVNSRPTDMASHIDGHEFTYYIIAWALGHKSSLLHNSGTFANLLTWNCLVQEMVIACQDNLHLTNHASDSYLATSGWKQGKENTTDPPPKTGCRQRWKSHIPR